MGYDQKALQKLFTPKPANPVSDISPTAEIIASESPVPIDGCKKIVNLAITDLEDYPKQLFKPYTEERLRMLEMSIRENGIIEPLLVRNLDGVFQIVCGHNRRTAAAQAGFETVPCIVEEMSDDDADIKMVETNLRVRTGLFPSEKGFAYRAKLEAMKHQGLRTDLSSTPTVVEVRGKESADILGDQVGESGSSINNYIRLTYLITPLLDLVDVNTIPIKPAVELSYMSLSNQETVHTYFFVSNKLYIDEQLAKRLKEQGRIAELTEENIAALLPAVQGKTVKQTSKFSIPTKPLLKLLDTNALTKDVEKEILAVLIEYFEKKKNG